MQLAPEVLSGNYYDGFLSDVWSLGVILYITVSATPPFFGESVGEVVQRIVAGGSPCFVPVDRLGALLNVW